ncbi:D-inositol-3-phosphate glycosyltransferase [Emticicia aquatica]|uniref:D-inositol-3-phosphate glycosyltransferase n=1 Tax=Emticicia aquatica TaxID=1681835 RepID=A0ABM9ALN0_9BACT|nr:glycosyltransferase family 1 protein [Emticicia aquatica]CAH0994151.1 D-inositol-3-phosphate glycosyltransferase [Emticicia aquatica]
MNKVILDTSVLGLGYFHEQSRTGIFRVAEELFKGLHKNDEIELSLANIENLPEMMSYLKKYFPESQFDLVNKKSDKFRAKFESAIISIFPIKSFPQKAIREAFVRTRGYIKPQFSFNPKSLSAYDIYHSPFLPIPKELKGMTKPKKIITIHDLIPHLFPQYFGEWNKMMMRKILESIDENTFPVCVSEATKNDLCEATGISADRISVVHLAASKEIFHPENDKIIIEKTLEKYNIPSEKKYLLSVSTLEPRKNIERTIRAFLHLVQQEKINDLNLVLVGAKGWQFDAIFEEIKSNSTLKDRIICTGFVADEDLAALYSSAIGFVYPSLYEGFGLPPLEALQCGTPVISSTKSSIPEVVGDAGILVEPTDENAISQAMLQFYQNENLRHKLSKKAIEQAEKFSWEKFVDEHIKIYQEVS